ncbi:putative Nudix hydrolase family protein [Lyophyllum shimeji]|uniref:Nudix hydrolase family protein n=1 Tax=Lyophyllum shimeji TaxID=47721 RepID=A0A9P3PG32_LYOSH|nr:putative Nudix hydrolase family protein [Lyophyllum shimeji]
MASTPRVLSSTELSPSEAKWITLKRLTYLDANGKERLWEVAERKTRKSTGIDAVAVLAILRSKTKAFPVSTVVIEQYRPPIDKVIVELPAGLIDEGETPEQAAIRELEEETGYKADGVIEATPVVVTDPGMTNANMKLVVVNVTLPDQMEFPRQKLDVGEFISTRVVELAKLETELKEYAKNGFVVDARLAHFAFGWNLAGRIDKI